MSFQFRNILLGVAIVALTACSLPADVTAPQVAMGDFRFGHNIVVVEAPEIGPFSRKAEDEAWKEALTSAMALRFDGYEGEKFYHIGIKMDAYVLALPGVPLVFKPKSVLVVTVNVWDDSLGEKVNEEPKVLTVFEGISEETLISSGLTQNKTRQMTKLSNNMAKMIQDWILENPEWIGLPPLSEDAVTGSETIIGSDVISEATLDAAPAN